MATSSRIRNALRFGGRVPLVIGSLIVAIFVLSVVAALGQHNGLPLFSYAALVPAFVWHGEVWRLVTWVFFEDEPLPLVFTCMLLYWFGRDLAMHWGTARFLRIYVGLTLAVAVVVCLIGHFVWPHEPMAYLGSKAISSALVIAWALTFPEREMLFFFALRVSGRQLLYLELGLTALFTIYYGVVAMLHIIVASLLMLAYMYRFWMRRRLDAFTSRRAAPNLRVWDDKKGDFRPTKPKWVN